MLIISPDREYVFNTYNFYIDQSANMPELYDSMYSYHTYGLMFSDAWCRSAIEGFYIKYEGSNLMDMDYSMVYKNLLFTLKAKDGSDDVFVYNENDVLYLIYRGKCIKLPSGIKIVKRYGMDNELSSLFLVRKNNKVYLSINDTIYEVENQGGMLRNTKDMDDVYYSDEKLFKLIRRKTLLGKPT